MKKLPCNHTQDNIQKITISELKTEVIKRYKVEFFNFGRYSLQTKKLLFSFKYKK